MSLDEVTIQIADISQCMPKHWCLQKANFVSVPGKSLTSLCFIVCILVLEKFFALSSCHIFCHFGKVHYHWRFLFSRTTMIKNGKSGEGTANTVLEPKSLNVLFIDL